MSAKAKKPRARTAKKEAEEEKPAPAKKERIPRPKGLKPQATVISRRGRSMVERQGKGFSIRELQGADFPLVYARRWNLKLDARRRSVLEGNVRSLKKWFPQPAKVAEPKPAPAVSKVSATKEKPKKRAPRKKSAK
ncbi:MAG: hypothetical protein LYZ66_06195 [Nitrososphaerales archaeon]|nr:hypothetical protein [Nitrososphaerales archaeon]